MLSDRRPQGRLEGAAPAGLPDADGGLREMVDDLSSRLQRLEEERDFYKDLLDAPARKREIEPPSGAGE